MIEPPELAEVPAVTAAVIACACARADMPAVFPAAISELDAALAAQGIAATGPVFAHHLRMPGAVFEFEVGVPIGASVAPSGRVRPGGLPAARVARTVYHGDYAGLPGAWGDVAAWLREHGHSPAPTLWEVYAVGPAETPDPAAWTTELVRPLA